LVIIISVALHFGSLSTNYYTPVFWGETVTQKPTFNISYIGSAETTADSLLITAAPIFATPPVTAKMSHIVSPLESCVACTETVAHHRCQRECTVATSTHWNNETLLSLRDTSILFIGDSLAWQFQHATQCYTAQFDNVTVDFEAMHMFPLHAASLDALLNRDYDTIVIAVGTWYNVDEPEEWRKKNSSSASPPMITPNTTTELCQAHCPPRLYDYLSTPKPPPTYESALRSRKECRDLTRRTSFISGLMRLRDAIQRRRAPVFEKGVVPDGIRRRPHIIWKDVAPQHFPNVPSGGFDSFMPNKGRCSAIGNQTLAYKRNRVANKVIFPNSNNSDAALTGLLTWGDDVDKWRFHPGGDCTHFCNPSVVTWNWVSKLLRVIADHIS